MIDSQLERLGRSINLRDLGGIAAADGREVRRGAVFRSAALTELTPDERAALSKLGLRAIIDLRTHGERAEQPTPWEDLGCLSYWALDDAPTDGGGLSDFFAGEAMSYEAARAMMVRVYQTLPYRHVEALQRLFRALAGGEAPLLFHCTSGKDRTGMSAALLLSALGAGREVIAADYLASLNFDVLASAAFRSCPPERLEALRPLYLVHRDYLNAMFGAIEGCDGSVEAYLRRTLALTPSELASLRDNLLA
jgi:protein-tyrosine phosphatase